MNEYVPIGTLTVLIIGILIKTNTDLTKRPTFESVEKRYRLRETCDAVHRSVDANLKEIKTDLKSLLKKNGL